MEAGIGDGMSHIVPRQVLCPGNGQGIVHGDPTGTFKQHWQTETAP